MTKSRLVVLMLGISTMTIVVGGVTSENKEDRSRIFTNFSTNILSAALALIASEQENFHDDIK